MAFNKANSNMKYPVCRPLSVCTSVPYQSSGKLPLCIQTTTCCIVDERTVRVQDACIHACVCKLHLIEVCVDLHPCCIRLHAFVKLNHNCMVAVSVSNKAHRLANSI